MMKNPILLFIAIVLLATACNSVYTPRERGYFRIDFPKHEYRLFDQPGYPYSFEYPVYGVVAQDSTLFDDNPDNPYWINLDFPEYKGRIYISYKSIGGKSVYMVKSGNGYKDSIVQNTFESLREEAFRMTYKHTVKASGIVDSPFLSANGIAGLYFKVEGNAATARQFFLTDTSRHFLRGALYFDSAPNADSLAMVNTFLEEDMKHLISTLRWKQSR